VKRWLLGIAALLLVAGLIVVVRARTGDKTEQSGGREARGARPVQVVVAPAVQRDVPIYLEGLGSVTAYRTVAVKAQVDGRLEQVFFREGQAVKKGEALAQIDPRPFRAQLHQAEGALARDLALLANARLNVARDRRLVAQKFIAQQQLDTDIATANQLEGTVQIDRAAIETARLNLDYARIVSPVDGVTGVRIVDPGNLVHANDANGIVVVTQLDPISVLFTLPQDELPRLSAEMERGKLRVQAFNRDGATLLGEGELLLIDNQINQATATLRLKAVFENGRRTLWPNQFVKARLLLMTRQGALVVPSTALQRGPSGTFVFVVDKDSKAQPRTVRAEPRGEIAIVDEGLAAGEQVVADGQSQLRAGSVVTTRTTAGLAGKKGKKRPADDSPKSEAGSP
jgi:membrane fusion protein, multidrug efflux system